ERFRGGFAPSAPVGRCPPDSPTRVVSASKPKVPVVADAAAPARRWWCGARRRGTDPRVIFMTYEAAADRYDSMTYRRSGRSGSDLPLLSLGLWHNFGSRRPFEPQRDICRRAFDLGITHFDLANNYGPPYGSAEENFGRVLSTDFRPYRD